MERWLARIALIAAALVGAGCTGPRCGAGTKQMQDANGDVECVVADEAATGNEPCDTDGGTAVIVGGICVSRVTCDPATTKFDPATGLCVATSGPSACSCAAPGAGKICVFGDIRDFDTGAMVDGSRPLDVAAYEPLTFLSDPTKSLGEEPSTTRSCYSLTVPVPSTGLVAIAVKDAAGQSPSAPLAIGAVGAAVTAGNSYHVDAYTVAGSRLDGWRAVDPAIGSGGAYVGCYFRDKPQPPSNMSASETMPASGVHLVANGAVAANAHYLAADRAIDSTLTATGALGCAVVAGAGSLGTYSGSGAAVTKWETQPGASTAGVVFVARFHNCDIADAGTASCQ